MPIDTDFHSHVSYTSVAQMARSAREKHLRILGLSEHIFQFHEIRPLLPHLPQEGPFLHLDEYFQQIATTRAAEDLEIRIGLEVDFIPEKNEQLWQAIE